MHIAEGGRRERKFFTKPGRGTVKGRGREVLKTFVHHSLNYLTAEQQMKDPSGIRRPTVFGSVLGTAQAHPSIHVYKVSISLFSADFVKNVQLNFF